MTVVLDTAKLCQPLAGLAPSRSSCWEPVGCDPGHQPGLTDKPQRKFQGENLGGHLVIVCAQLLSRV